MPKQALKIALREDQGGVDPLSGVPIPEEPRLYDTDRVKPKAAGGTYSEAGNVRVLEPVSHMERHGNLRLREEALEELKSIFDDRVQVMRFLLKTNNQLLAYERRTDHPHPETVEFLRGHLIPIKRRLAEIDKQLTKAISAYPDPTSQAALAFKGLGPITVAALAVYVDLAKAATPSALWKYTGLHCSSGDRYTKGEVSGGNKTLRTVLWNSANVLMKLRESGYRIVYDRTKDRLAQSERIVKSRNTQGMLVEVAWKDAKPSHRHGAALRAIMKHLLADYWLVGRTLQGLPTTPLYAESMLGHSHIIAPKERGWEY